MLNPVLVFHHFLLVKKNGFPTDFVTQHPLLNFPQIALLKGTPTRYSAPVSFSIQYTLLF